VHGRYRASAQGKQREREANNRRIYIGAHYHGKAPTVERAAVIRQHVKERIQCYLATVDKSES
jgi:hypothetical protein